MSQWVTGARQLPEDRAPAVEFWTDFAVPVETSCPGTRWVRVRHPDWPNGKPLIDKSPLVTYTPAAKSGSAQPAAA